MMARGEETLFLLRLLIHNYDEAAARRSRWNDAGRHPGCRSPSSWCDMICYATSCIVRRSSRYLSYLRI